MPYSIATEVWFDFSTACAAVSTVDGLCNLLAASVRRLGFDRVNISIMRDYSLPDAVARFGLWTSYPEDWQRYYAERNCIRFDPVALRARGDAAPFYWADLARDHDLSRLQQGLMGLAKDAHLHNGIGLPFFGLKTLRGGIALATSSPQDEHLRDLNLLYAFSSLYHRRLRELSIEGSWHRLTADLSDRELDVLALAAAGHSDEVIASRLKISDNTVNTHFRRIYFKIDANNRTHAVALAIQEGLI